ncbi:hypothetical protein BJH93_02630 [Kocuria polaris]|nr:hypothetical protein [Kocuria polaris]
MNNAATVAASLLVGTLIALGATACAPRTVADARYGGLPEGFEREFLPGEEQLIAVEVDGSLAVVTWGSSSCLPTAVEFSVSGERADVVFDPPREDVCTADLGPTTHVFNASTVGPRVPSEVAVTFEDDGSTHVVDVVRD